MNTVQCFKDMDPPQGSVSFFDGIGRGQQRLNNLITRKEAATLLGISVTTLDAAKNSGKIAYVQYVENGSVFYTKTALEEYVARSTHPATPQKENRMTYRNRRA